MSVYDFVKKEARIAREQGIKPAVKQGAGEAVMKAGGPYASWRSTPIWAADWGVCLVLDSCRLDLFEEAVAGGGLPASATVDSRWSVGSASPQWINRTFSDRYASEWRRAGYVTANPFSGKRGDELNVMDPDVYPLTDRGLAYLDEVWRDQWPDGPELPTIKPAIVTDRALWAYQRDDMERLVVHYMQPHIPFRSRPEWCPGWELSGFGTGGGLGDKDDWHKVRDGEIPREAFWNAYRDNLEWVLDEVHRWCRATDARILVTSDHGNGMGEWGQWGHPPESANPAIRRVPWVIIDGNGGGEPVDVDPPGDPPVTESTTDNCVDEQLEALGYA